MCGKDKPLADFYKQKAHSKKRGTYIYYHPECKECTKQRSRNWEKENPDKRKVIRDKYESKEHTKELKRAAKSRYRKDGKQLEWQRDNQDKIRIYNKKRQNKDHDISKQEWKDCKKFFNDSCAYCGMSEKEHEDLFGTDLHKEHVDHDGSNDISNCVPSCRSCNSKKWIFSLDEWYDENNEVFSKRRLNKINKWLSKFNRV